jgi:hypothetical protein
MGDRRGLYRFLVGNPEGKSPLGRPRRRCEDNIKKHAQEGEWGGMYWIDLPQDRERRRVFIERGNKILGSEKCGKFLD